MVGFKVRFQDRLSRDASVKLMTDGILLAETLRGAVLGLIPVVNMPDSPELQQGASCETTCIRRQRRHVRRMP